MTDQLTLFATPPQETQPAAVAHQEVLLGNALDLSAFTDKSFHCIVTSPPYWMQRSYLVGAGGGELGSEQQHDCLGWATGRNCGSCYVCHLRQVFAQCWRILRDDGTLWLNLGDSYNGTGGAGGDYNPGGIKEGQPRFKGHHAKGLKPKDLAGIPWLTALALRSDGWYLRRDIIWIKPNAMPESCPDRPTNQHEYLFLMSKSERYYYDAFAIREPLAHTPGTKNKRTGWYTDEKDEFSDVLEVNTKPFKGGHYAAYPPALITPAIQAGTSARGVCPTCGAPWRRVIKKGFTRPANEERIAEMIAKGVPRQKANLYTDNGAELARKKAANPDQTLGWKPTCDCPNNDAVPATVFDPFAGAGTTGVVCKQLDRNFIGTELNPDYVTLANNRIANTKG